MTNRLLNNKLLYDHYRNIKLLELYPNQNSQLGFESLNYGYSGIDSNFYIPKFPDIENTFNYVDIGNEGFLDNISAWLSKLFEWLKDIVVKIYTYIKNNFFKLYNFLKDLLFKFINWVRGKKSKQKSNVTKEDIKTKISEFKNWLLSIKIPILSYNDFNELFNFYIQITKHLNEILKNYIDSIIGVVFNNSNIAFTINAILTNKIFKDVESKYQINMSKMSNELKNFLLGQQKSSEDFPPKINGLQALTFATPNNNKELSIFNATTQEQIEDGYNEIINLLQNQITILEKQYIPELEKTEKFSNINEIENILIEYLKNEFKKLQNDKNNETYFIQYEEKIKIIQNNINNNLLKITRIPETLITIQINKLSVMYNQIIQKIVSIFKSIEIDLNEQFVYFKNTNGVESMLKNLKGKEYSRIHEMPVYLVSTLAKCIDIHKYPHLSYTLMSVVDEYKNQANAMCILVSITHTTFIIISDILLKINNKPELINFTIGHEYGHYKNTHSAKTLLRFLSLILKGMVSTSQIETGTIKKELEADLYGAQYSSPDAGVTSLKRILAYEKSPTSSYFYQELMYRIKFLEYVKKIGIDNVNVEEYLNKNPFIK